MPLNPEKMFKKPWEELSADDKADLLRSNLRDFIDHSNGAMARIIDRITKLENEVKAQKDKT